MILLQERKTQAVWHRLGSLPLELAGAAPQAALLPVASLPKSRGIDPFEEDPTERRERTAGWMLSLLLHAALILSAGISLAPKIKQAMVPLSPPASVDLVAAPEPVKQTAAEPPPVKPGDMAQAVVRKPQPKKVVVAPKPKAAPAAASATRPTQLAQPDYLRNPPPVYPDAARQKKEQGVVYVWVKISPVGGVETVRVVRSSGFSDLDQSAAVAVEHWRFHPALAGVKPVESQAVVPVRFYLQ
ncbi:energy transducer TonB [Verrucomicrobium sp. 3C]|uniref:energy transducer TonB n=1 Tax=Verrucomicrobium sp. 3C TaxID=1134055 RepID=UPI00036FAD2B|nr:energy transducer TonB [Verrucomicrobium sp. 3C]